MIAVFVFHSLIKMKETMTRDNFFKISSTRIINLAHVIDITIYDDIGEYLVDPDFENQFGIVIQLETEDDIIFTGEKAKHIWSYFSATVLNISGI